MGQFLHISLGLNSLPGSCEGHIFGYWNVSRKYNNFLQACWFLAKNLANIVSLPWKLDNPNCHNQRQEWTDTEDNHSVKVKNAPFYQNRAASNPSLAPAPAPAPAPRGGSGLSVADQPFNYIAFSQQLYGDKPPDKNLRVKTLDKPKQRTISYVWNKTKKWWDKTINWLLYT